MRGSGGVGTADDPPVAPIGRSRELDDAVDALSTGRADHVLVRSGPAQGRTSFLAHLAHRLASATGTAAVAIIAGDGATSLAAVTAILVDEALATGEAPDGPTASESPTGPAAFVPDQVDHAPSAVGTNRTAPPTAPTAEVVGAITRATRRLLGDRQQPPVVAVDDAHLLDDISAEILAATARAGGTLLLGTGRTDPLPPALRRLVRSGRVHQLGLEPLGDGDIARLATAELIGPIEPVLVKALTRLVGGAPAAVIDVLRHARATGSIRRLGHVWRLTDNLVAPPATIDSVDDDLRRLPPDALELVDTLALADAVRLDLLDTLVDPRLIESLEAAGVLSLVDADHTGPAMTRPPARAPARAPATATAPAPARAPATAPAPMVRLTDPVVCSVRRAVMPHSRRRRIARRALDLLRSTTSVEGGPTPDALLDATLTVELGIAPDGDTARAAARAAHRAHDDERAADLARTAWTQSGLIDDALLLAEILTVLGRNAEADALLERPTASEPEHLALVAMARSVNLAQHLERIDDGERVLDEAVERLGPGDWSAEIIGLRAVNRLLVGDAIAALELATPWLDQDGGRSFVEAATAAGPALVVVGRHLDAAEMAGRAVDERTRLGDQPFLSSPGLHALVRSMALAEAGRFAEADALSNAVIELAAAIGDRDGQAWAGIIGGRSLLDQGRLDEARVWFEIAASASISGNRVQHLRWSRAGIVLAAAEAGDAEGARRALDALDACPSTLLGLMEPEVQRARAWAHIARHDVTHGRAILLQAADAARNASQPGLEIRSLHDLIRLSDTREIARLAEVGAAVQGELPRLRVAHGSALAADDADGLMGVSHGFEAIGALLFAAEAANQAAWLQRRDGRPVAAEACRRRVVQLRGARPGVATPALDPLPGIAWLTAREREITMAAAAGASSKQIAAQLGLSVRTVDNLLQRAYRKLGLHGRAELRALRLAHLE